MVTKVDIIIIILMATGNENPSAMAQTYQFILNLVPAAISMFAANQAIRYVFRYFSSKQEERLNKLIELNVDPKISKLEAKIDLLIKMSKDDRNK